MVGKAERLVAKAGNKTVTSRVESEEVIELGLRRVLVLVQVSKQLGADHNDSVVENGQYASPDVVICCKGSSITTFLGKFHNLISALEETVTQA